MVGWGFALGPAIVAVEWNFTHQEPSHGRCNSSASCPRLSRVDQIRWDDGSAVAVDGCLLDRPRGLFRALSTSNGKHRPQPLVGGRIVSPAAAPGLRDD